MTLRGFIFDFDGLILDTEKPIFTTWQKKFLEYGFSFTYEHYQKIIGSDHSEYDPAEDLSQLIEGTVTAQALREDVFNQARDLVYHQPILPGVLDFLENAKIANFNLSVASSSSRDWVEGHLSRLGIRDFFNVVCTANDVTKVKPDPELYNLAMQKTGLRAEEVIVFEDSPNGVTAAKSSGAVCIAIPNDITKSMNLTHADKIIDSFIGLDPLELGSFLSIPS